MKKIVLLVMCFSFCLLAFACIPKKYVPKSWSATGGSRADAVVRLSYEYVDSEIPQLNANQALALAEERCKTWGYSGAEPFGGEIRVCNQMSVTFGGVPYCASWLVTKEFQCTGKGDSPQPAGERY